MPGIIRHTSGMKYMTLLCAVIPPEVSILPACDTAPHARTKTSIVLLQKPIDSYSDCSLLPIELIMFTKKSDQKWPVCHIITTYLPKFLTV